MLAPKANTDGASAVLRIMMMMMMMTMTVIILDYRIHPTDNRSWATKKGQSNCFYKSSPAVRRGSISMIVMYPTVDFDEYLKLRLGKLIEVSNYVSSSAQNLDSTSNMLEAAFALEKKFPQLKQTQEKLSTKTSTEAKMGIKVYDEKYQTVNANSLELVVGLDKSLEMGCYQGEERVESARRIQELTDKNKSQKAEIESLKQQLEELRASNKSISQRKRDKEGIDKGRTKIKIRRAKSLGDGSGAVSASSIVGPPVTQRSKSDETGKAKKRRKKAVAALPRGPTGQDNDDDLVMAFSGPTGPTGPTGNNQ